jgi:ATP-dependent DNA helicase DinG
MRKSNSKIKEIFTSIPKSNPEFNFEERLEQIKMSEEIQEAFKNHSFLAIEAGTGIGKSLAYLIPAIQYSLENDKLVVISTETIALQNQLIEKDIPFIKKIMDLPNLKAELAFGASNYLCKRRMGITVQNGNIDQDMIPKLKDFYAWENETKTGMKKEFKGFLTNSFWSSVQRESELCLGRNCPNFSISYYFLEKEKWKNANILIVNHYLLATHYAMGKTVLPQFNHLIIDEAHSFPDILGKTLKISLNFKDIEKIFQSFITKDKKKINLAGKLPDNSLTNKLISNTLKSQDEFLFFYKKLQSDNPILYQTKRIIAPLEIEKTLFTNLENLINNITSLKNQYKEDSESIDEKELYIELDSALKQCISFKSFFERLKQGPNSETVIWIDPIDQNKKDDFLTINIQPSSSENLLEESFYPEMETLVFTSATLSAGKLNFQYFLKQINHQNIQTLSFSSPFPYHKNCLIYLPKNVNDPVSNEQQYLKDLSILIPNLIELTKGNTFILFTSNKLLRECYEMIKEKTEYNCISQLDLGADKSKEIFLNHENSVLFGVSTFWQGIDIKGDKLRSVIITKLPFQPPGEPVLESRIEWIKKKNGNPFLELQLPHSIITLKQGFGRLIRSNSDKGFVAILDPRLQSKSYGSEILNSLPNAKKIYSFKELRTAVSLLYNPI